MGLEQVPDAGSQVPATWHWSRAEQMTGLLPTHRPLSPLPSQVSVWVHALPSLQGVPAGCGSEEGGEHVKQQA